MIYVHIPFCRSFCTYCDFYSEVAVRCRKDEQIRQQEELFRQFADALVAEVKLRGSEFTTQNNTLYIGGGTPSVLPLRVFRRLLSALEDVGCCGPYEEFTVEVNPEDIVENGIPYVKGLLELGVNRISMGVQSFDDDVLKFMNRRHDARIAREAYSILEAAGVKNISIDLIFGLPQLSDDQWKDTLDKALHISASGTPPRHISAYQLSVEPGSMLARLVEKGKFEEASEELCEHQYSMLCEALAHAGYRHYEISNFAQPGYEAVHNSAYWRHVPYVGLGPGAHSYSTEGRCHCNTLARPAVRQWNLPDLQAYITDPASVQESETLDEEQLVLEKIMLALRTDEGIAASFLEEHCDPHSLQRALEAGNLIRTTSGMYRIPEERFFVSDSVITSII